MLNNLRRYYNQNRRKIWKVIIVIAFAFAMLQVANTIARNNSERQIRQAIAQTEVQQRESNNESNEVVSSNTSKTTGINKKISTIEQFVNFCNQQDLENAYNMLTNNCKEEMFSDIDTFKNIYYESTFENKSKVVSIEKWTNNTYMVKYTEDALATGKIATTKEEQKLDYITVIEDEDNNYKLNINSYIGYEEIDKTKEDNNVTIEVLGKHTYMNYETYVVKIINKSSQDIILDDLENSESIYIEDNKGVKYSSYSGELTQSMMKVLKGHTKQLSIRFFSSYVSTKSIKQLVFSNCRINNEKTSFRHK